NVDYHDSNHLRDQTEIFLLKATGPGAQGLHTDVGSVSGIDTVSNATLTATDPANYTGTPAGIAIVKAINAVDPTSPTATEDANDPTHPFLLAAGSNVVWTYKVTNLTNQDLTGVKVVDDNGTPNNPNDDIVLITPTSGDNNHNGALDKNETWVFTTPTRTAVAGLFTNVATAHGANGGTTYFDNDPATYFGWVVALHIQKATNAADPNNPTPLEDGNTAP